MPYITQSRKHRDDQKVEAACERISGMFAHARVERRGRKSIGDIAADATAKGFMNIVIVGKAGDGAVKRFITSEPYLCATVLRPLPLGASYAWGGEYIVLESEGASQPRILGADGSDATERFVDEARE